MGAIPSRRYRWETGGRPWDYSPVDVHNQYDNAKVHLIYPIHVVRPAPEKRQLCPPRIASFLDWRPSGKSGAAAMGRGVGIGIHIHIDVEIDIDIDLGIDDIDDIDIEPVDGGQLIGSGP